MNDYIGIRGWLATVKSITTENRDGKLWILGKMALLPYLEDRRMSLGGEDLGLDVLFHCYNEDTALLFKKTISERDHLIVSGDLSARNWLTTHGEPDTNFWLDEFTVDRNNQKVSPLVGVSISSNEDELLDSADRRYAGTCVFCGGNTSDLFDIYTSRTYCGTCDV